LSIWFEVAQKNPDHPFVQPAENGKFEPKVPDAAYCTIGRYALIAAISISKDGPLLPLP